MDDTLQKKLHDIVIWLQKEFTGIRTGQAAPGLLDSVKVESYGATLPLNQVGSIGIEDARTLRISPWDASQVSAIEKAVRDADLGVSVASDSSGLRVIFPELTAERRTQLMKLAKSKQEDARVSVRSVRDEAMKTIDAAQKTGDISEDERYAQKERVQSAVEATNQALEKLYVDKEKEMSRS